MTQTELPDVTNDHAASPVADPGIADRFAAGWTAETIKTDAWSYEQRVRGALRGEIWDRLDDEAKTRIQQSSRTGGSVAAYERALMDEAGKAREMGAPEWQNLPASFDDLQQEVDRRRRAALDDAEAILGDEFSFSGFAGSMARAATDETSLALMPFGAGGTLLRIGAKEAALGALGEAMILPREFRVARDLDLEDPDITSRLAMGAGFGAGAGVTLAAIPRFYRYAREKRQVHAEAKPDGVNPIEHAEEIEARRIDLEFGEDATNPIPEPERLSAGEGDLAPKPSGPPRMRDFDYSDQGNASRRHNRIGYVFGKLLELGYEPHIAAGLAGNLMQESGVGINTRAVGDNGNAYGMAQWNGPRRRAYLRFAQEQGTPPENVDTQIAFLHKEMTGSERAAAEKILRATDARSAAAIASNEFWRPGIPHIGRRMAYADAVFGQFQNGQVPRWQGAKAPPSASGGRFDGFGTSRGYTSTGQLMAGDNLRIDVEYEVVDASLLRQASGDLQPRDRSRTNSDAWVNDTAARLDPALLMPAPTADRGAPVVGPDNVIESGNGRVRAINRTYDKFSDRADAYRKQIEITTGAPIPEGIERPVLIARRTSDLTPEARRQLVVDAQDSGVARMTATERAQVGQRALSSDVLTRMQPGRKLSAAENRDFARAFAGAFPRSERNAFVGPDGRISTDGIRQIQDSLFARAWDAPDIVARAIEAEPGELKTLLDALANAAPEMAQLRADIDAGLVRAEMDITPFILDAARLIVTARDLAEKGGQAGHILNELLAEVDLLDGAVAPLTQALVRKMMPDGRQAPAKSISDFLKRYAVEARKAGRVGDALSDPPGPLDVLKRLDAEAFGDLTETGLAKPRTDLDVPKADFGETAFAQGARSPEAEAADLLAEQELRGTRQDETAGPDAAAPETPEQPAPEIRDLELEMPDGTKVSARDLLADLDGDEALEAVIDACTLGSA